MSKPQPIAENRKIAPNMGNDFLICPECDGEDIVFITLTINKYTNCSDDGVVPTTNDKIETRKLVCRTCHTELCTTAKHAEPYMKW